MLCDRNFSNGEFVSLDVASLFTNVPVPATLEIFQTLLVSDDSLSQRTVFTVEELLDLFHIVLSSCYFCHYDGLFVQTKGATMGSSLGPVAANIFMASFETEAFKAAKLQGLRVPTFWVRYVDDILLFWPYSNDELVIFFIFLCSFRPTRV